MDRLLKLGVGPSAVSGVPTSSQTLSQQKWWSDPLVHKAVDRICFENMMSLMDGPSFSLGFSQEIMSQPESQSTQGTNLYDSQTQRSPSQHVIEHATEVDSDTEHVFEADPVPDVHEGGPDPEHEHDAGPIPERVPESVPETDSENMPVSSFSFDINVDVIGKEAVKEASVLLEEDEACDDGYDDTVVGRVANVLHKDDLPKDDEAKVVEPNDEHNDERADDVSVDEQPKVDQPISGAVVGELEKHDSEQYDGVLIGTSVDCGDVNPDVIMASKVMRRTNSYSRRVMKTLSKEVADYCYFISENVL